MAERRDPGVFTRMRAALQGERNAATLAALRDAGTAVYEELTHADAETIGWDSPTGTCSHALATWNAYALQTLGETLLDADGVDSGFVPPATFDLAWHWLGQVQPWLSRARQARSSSAYDIRTELALPAEQTSWPADPVSGPHLRGLLDAEARLRERAEYAVYALGGQKRPAYQDDRMERLSQYVAIASAAADYARTLTGSVSEPTTDRIALVNLRQAISGWYQIGQLAAFPALLRRLRLPREHARFDLSRLPDGDRFDPWCLTDEATLAAWQADPRAVRQLTAMWQADPDPAATLQVKAEIELAVADGAIVRVFLPGKVTCFHRCPWSSIYEVRRPSVTIAGRRFGMLQQFALDVSADEMYWGRPFVRRLVLGPFQINAPIPR